MKKQTTILTQTQPRKEWMLIAVIVALVTKNQSKSSVATANLPLNAAQETLANLFAELANLFQSGESFVIALAGLIVLAICYNRMK